MMPENIDLYAGIYLLGISLIAIGLTAYDKRAARIGSWRVAERTLLLVSVLGGSIAMLMTMRLTRHKTKHAQFMIGIPITIILQIAAVIFVWWLSKGGAG